MTWVKLCAMTNAEDARAAVRAGADAVGLIFAPSTRRIDVATAAAITAELPPHIEKVGVFSNERADVIRNVAQRAGLTAVQLHGDEDAQFARELFTKRTNAQPQTLKIIKTVHVVDGMESVVREFAQGSGVDTVLLDSVTSKTRGGTGTTFDWQQVAELLAGVSVHVRVIVAGGLRPENVSAAISILRPWGVDVASGVEREPGKKDFEKMNAFVDAVRQAEKRS